MLHDTGQRNHPLAVSLFCVVECVSFEQYDYICISDFESYAKCLLVYTDDLCQFEGKLISTQFNMDMGSFLVKECQDGRILDGQKCLEARIKLMEHHERIRLSPTLLAIALPSAYAASVSIDWRFEYCGKGILVRLYETTEEELDFTYTFRISFEYKRIQYEQKNLSNLIAMSSCGWMVPFLMNLSQINGQHPIFVISPVARLALKAYCLRKQHLTCQIDKLIASHSLRIFDDFSEQFAQSFQEPSIVIVSPMLAKYLGRCPSPFLSREPLENCQLTQNGPTKNGSMSLEVNTAVDLEVNSIDDLQTCAILSETVAKNIIPKVGTSGISCTMNFVVSVDQYSGTYVLNALDSERINWQVAKPPIIGTIDAEKLLVQLIQKGIDDIEMVATETTTELKLYSLKSVIKIADNSVELTCNDLDRLNEVKFILTSLK